jgi:hypothetical protein
LEGEASKEATNVKYKNLLVLWRKGAGHDVMGELFHLGLAGSLLNCTEYNNMGNFGAIGASKYSKITLITIIASCCKILFVHLFT